MKIAFSGTHGTGKTTSALNKAKELKLKYPTKTVGILSENVINCPLPINKKATIESQLWIFGDQLSKEIEMANKFDILICDRSIFDVVAYTWRIDDKVSLAMFNIAIKMVDTYNTIFFKRLKNNNYLFNDGLRDTTDKEFREYIDTQLEYFFFIIKEMGAKVKIVEV
ncbi:MAG: ATP-binding protein [Candidatus Desulfofervidus auxilii]|nr:ATP-binding protein [Candidatus Desulfofervidus auxilii]